MTISTETNLAVYQGNGATTVFAFPFYVLEEGDLEIQLQAAESGTVTHTYVSGEYTLSGIGDPAGGSVTILGTPITSDYKLTIERVLSYTQPLDLVNETGFYPDEVEKQFDRDVMQTQQLKRLIDAAITVPKGETGFTLPAASTRASKYLAFDAGGDLVTVAGTSSDPAVTANMLRVTSRAALKALNVTLYALAFLDHVSGGVFKLRQGAMPTDVQEGIYIASDTATYYWEREWDGIHAKVEWFGALPDDNTAGTANVTAIHAALALCPKVVLGARDYWTNATIKHNYANTELLGAGGKYDSANGLRGTRLILASATADILQLGPDSSPGAIGTFRQNVRAKGIFCMRSIAPEVTTASTSIRVQWLLEAYLEDMTGYNSMLGWQFHGSVHCTAYNCTASRDLAGTGGTDSWKGFVATGTSGVGAGGNPSLYLVQCHADDNRTVKTNSVGFYADSKFTDNFWIRCETVSCTVGMQVIGNGSATYDAGSADLTIEAPKNDAWAVYGLWLSDFGLGGTANITVPYGGAASGATSAIQINDCAGAINFIGGEQLLNYASTCVGATIVDSSGVHLLGTIISEAGSNGAVVLSSADGCRIEPHVVNDSVTGGPAVKLTGSNTGNKIGPMVRGKVSGVTFGIQALGTAITFTGALVAATSGTLTGNWAGVSGVHAVVFSDGSVRDVTLTNGATSATWSGAVTATASASACESRRNEFNCTGIDSDCVNGGSGNKLVMAGAQNTTAYTASGTNLPTGVMA
jgi:hypothetical protein